MVWIRMRKERNRYRVRKSRYKLAVFRLRAVGRNRARRRACCLPLSSESELSTTWDPTTSAPLSISRDEIVGFRSFLPGPYSSKFDDFTSSRIPPFSKHVSRDVTTVSSIIRFSLEISDRRCKGFVKCDIIRELIHVSKSPFIVKWSEIRYLIKYEIIFIITYIFPHYYLHYTRLLCNSVSR